MYLMNMDAEEAFWTMVEEIGSSAEDFKSLEIHCSINPRNNQVNLSKTVTKGRTPSNGAWEMKVLFNAFSENLADPQFMDKLAVFYDGCKNTGIEDTFKSYENILIDGWVEK